MLRCKRNNHCAWQTKGNSVTDSQKWYFEPCAYEKGDINQNGIIDSGEARLILRYSLGMENFTTLQLYLADIDGNGIINSGDSRLADRYSSGMMPNYIDESTEIM